MPVNDRELVCIMLEYQVVVHWQISERYHLSDGHMSHVDRYITIGVLPEAVERNCH